MDLLTCFPEPLLFFRLEILPIFRIFQDIFRTSYVCLGFWTSGRCSETWVAKLTDITNILTIWVYATIQHKYLATIYPYAGQWPDRYSSVFSPISQTPEQVLDSWSSRTVKVLHILKILGLLSTCRASWVSTGSFWKHNIVIVSAPRKPQALHKHLRCEV